MQPERLRVVDQDAENPAAVREVADPLVGLLVDAHGQETLERPTGRIDHAERRVSRPRQLCRGLDDPLQKRVERELGRDRDAGVDQPAPAGVHPLIIRRFAAAPTDGYGRPLGVRQ